MIKDVLKAKLNQLDELYEKGLEQLEESEKEPDNKEKKKAYFKTCAMYSNKCAGCAILLQDSGYAPDLQSAFKMLRNPTRLVKELFGEEGNQCTNH